MSGRPSRACKVDGNQGEIVDQLRQIGATVQSMASVGDGCPDLLVGLNGRNYVFEVKEAGKGLRPRQVLWFGEWKGQADVVTCLADCLEVINARVRQ